MPDLQSELNKILTQKQFDDEEPTPATVVEADENNSSRARAWRFIKDHPNCSVADVAAHLGMTTPNIAGGLRKMVQRGNLTRHNPGDGSGFRYQVVGTEYKVLSTAERVALMQKARAAYQEQRAASPKPKKPKAKIKKPKLKPIKWVQDKPVEKSLAEMKRELIGVKSFNADEIIAGLTVLQAKELLVKLKEVFGV